MLANNKVNLSCIITDTFAGEANYAWKKTATLNNIDLNVETEESILRRVTELLGVRTEDWELQNSLLDDVWEFRPTDDSCLIIFVDVLEQE